MTVAAAGGATTINPHAPAVMLTEYAGGDDAPLYLINQGAGRLWIGGDSSVGPSNGVPLEGFTSLTWTTPGQVWAVADTTATAAIPLVVSSDLGAWQPSPVAIAAQVAAQLLATGIPSVLLTEIVADAQPLPAGQAATFDMSGYASAVLKVTTTFSPVGTLTQRTEPGGMIVDQEKLTTFRPIRFAVAGPQVTISNQDTADWTIDLIGSNRAALKRWDIERDANAGDYWHVSWPIGLGGPQTLTQDDDNVRVTGPCYASFNLPPGIDASWVLELPDGDQRDLAHSHEHYNTGDGRLRLTKIVALPRSDFTIGVTVWNLGAFSPGDNVSASVYLTPA